MRTALGTLHKPIVVEVDADTTISRSGAPVLAVVYAREEDSEQIARRLHVLN